MEKNKKILLKPYDLLISFVAIAFSLFQMYTAFMGSYTDAIQRSIHLGFALMLVFLIYDFKGGKGKKFSIIGLLLGLLCVLAAFYKVYYFQDLVFRQARINTMDFLIGLIILIGVIEASRRVIGIPLFIVAILSIIYGLFGNMIPGVLQHMGYSLKDLVDQLCIEYAANTGIFGITLGVSTTYVFIFILFGSFFKESGGTAFIMEFSKALIGKLTGGSAKLAVISSGLFGSISGSASANVTVTGSMTIPLMKRTGFNPVFAGAVEATASCGGLIMPPIMGAVGFIIAEVLGIEYIEVVKAAFLPATVYFISLYFGVSLYAKKTNVPKIPVEEIPSLTSVIRERWISAVPIIVLIYLLVIMRLSPAISAFGSIIAIVSLNMLSRQRMGITGILKCLRDGAETSLIVVTTLAIVGIPMGVIMVSGIGLKFGELLIQAGGGNLPLILVLAMIASLILGTGLEATSAYIMVSVLLIPALIKIGIPPITSHLFAFYFGVLSNVTPPVAITSYVASGLAKSNAFKTALTGFRLSIAGFLIPYMLVYRSGLLMAGSLFEIVSAFCILVIGVFALQAASMGFLFSKINIPFRILLLGTSVTLLYPNLLINSIGLIIIFSVISYLYYVHKKSTDLTPLFQKEIAN